MRFYLGIHRPAWLAELEVPLCVSYQTLRSRRRLPRSKAPWLLDSGAFSELQKFGNWNHGPTSAEYVDCIRRYSEEIGELALAAPADWMCEPAVLSGGVFDGVRFAGTGLSVAEHQRRTVENFCQLRDLAPDLPIFPVLQGWTVDDYVRCIDLYAAAGVDLASEPVAGVGSVCRRQGTREVAEIVYTIVDAVPGVALHAFGVKLSGLSLYGDAVASADSMAWSKAALYVPPMPGCAHTRCTNCPRFALDWRGKTLAGMQQRRRPRAAQLSLFDRRLRCLEPTEAGNRDPKGR